MLDDVLPRRHPVDRFVLWLQRSKPYSPRTITTYQDQLTAFRKWLDQHGLDVTQLTKDDLLDHYADLQAAGRAGSISTRQAMLRKLFDYLMDRGFVTSNPAKEIPFRTPQHRSGEPYTRGEVQRMFQACRTWQEKAVFTLMLGTGLRRSEVHRISRDDCNFENGTIRILRKGGRYQYVMPEPMVMHAVEMAMEFNDRLCWQKCSDYVARLVKNLGKRANVPGRHHPHRLRFTMAVEWCEAGGQESELMEALGHSSPRMTSYYSKVGREKRAMRTMSTISIAARLLGPVSA